MNQGFFATHYRVFFAVAALVVIVPAFWNVAHLVNQGTDQSTFQASESRYLLESDIPSAEFVQAFGLLNFQRDLTPRPLRGDLVTAVNGRTLNNYGDVDAVLGGTGPDMLLLEVQRPDRERQFITFRVSRRALQDAGIVEIPRTVHVAEVAQGGAAARAGLTAGDLIHTINSRPFADIHEARALMRSMSGGETVVYGVIRDGSYLQITVTMARLSIPLALVFFVLVGFGVLTVGLALGLFRGGLKAARLLAGGFLLLGMGYLLFEQRGMTAPGLPAFFSWCGLYGGIAFLMHASYYFPKEHVELLRQNHWRYGGYPLALVAVVATSMTTSQLFPLGVLLIATPTLVGRFTFRRSLGVDLLRLEFYLLMGLGFCIVMIAAWTWSHGRLSMDWDLALRAMTVAVVPLVYLFTAVRFGLLGITVKRGPLYTFVHLCWLALCGSVFLLLINQVIISHLNLLNINLTNSQLEVLRQTDPMIEHYNEKLTAILIAMVAFVLVWRFWMLGRGQLRKLFHRAEYDYLQVAGELTELFASRLDLNDLSRGLADSIARRMLLKRVAVMVFDEAGEVACAESGQDVDVQLKAYCRSRGAFMAKSLERYRTTLRVEYLGGELKGDLWNAGFRYLQPVRSKSKLVGCLLVGEKRSETNYRTEDFRFLSAASQQAAVAIENVLLYTRLAEGERLAHELELARHIQISSLPQSEPQVPGLDVAGTSIPAMEVGGDYYAYFTQQDGSLTVIVADVSGKGTSAALYMSKMQGIFASLESEGLRPKDLFIRANPILYRETERSAFVTALCVQFDTNTGQVHLARAGHGGLIHYAAQKGMSRLILPRGLGLGLENRGKFEALIEEISFTWQPGDIFVLVTDGITEAADVNNEMFGDERTMERTDASADKSATEIRADILAAVADFSFGVEQRDDQTIVVVKAGGQSLKRSEGSASIEDTRNT